MKQLYLIPTIFLFACAPLTPTVNLDYSSPKRSIEDTYTLWTSDYPYWTTWSVSREIFSDGISSCSIAGYPHTLNPDRSYSGSLLLREFKEGGGEIEFTFVGRNRSEAIGRWINISITSVGDALDLSGFKLIRIGEESQTYRGIISNPEEFRVVRESVFTTETDILYKVWWKDLNYRGDWPEKVYSGSGFKIEIVGDPTGGEYFGARHRLSIRGLVEGVDIFKNCLDK